MAAIPHDVTDLRLAPIALAVDAVIDELGRLPIDKLIWRLESHRDVPEITREDRERWLVAQVESRAEVANWELSIDDRGLRLTHREHSLVLGLPATLRSYLEGQVATQV